LFITHHTALEPHHVFPTHQGAVPQKSFPPHAVIPTYYHPIPVNPVNFEPVMAGSSESGMHMVQPHNALAAIQLTVNLGNRFAQHHHELLPENPIAPRITAYFQVKLEFCLPGGLFTAIGICLKH